MAGSSGLPVLVIICLRVCLRESGHAAGLLLLLRESRGWPSHYQQSHKPSMSNISESSNSDKRETSLWHLTLMNR